MNYAIVIVALTSVGATAVADEKATSGYRDSVELEKIRSDSSPYLFRASELLGEDVLNAKGEEIGEIEDLILTRREKGMLAVVSLGGVLGVGEKLVSVPYTKFRVSRDGEDVYLDATEDELKGLPAFHYNEGEKRGMVSSASEEADNTGRNERDQNDRTATPMDQSSSEADIETTRAIRQAIIDDKSLSVNAHNVKIITADGTIVLRGPVETNAERDRIAAIAKKLAGKNAVRNEIEVESD